MLVKTTQLEVLRNEAIRISDECKQIEVTDDTSLAVANQRLSLANDMVKQIEKTRKVLKQPSIDEGKMIDSIAGEIASPIEQAVSLGKSKILVYQQQQRAKQEAEAKRINDIKNHINRYSFDAMHAMNIAKTDADLVAAYEKYVKTFPGAETWQEFDVEAQTMRAQLKDYASQRRIVINKPAEADETVQAVIEEKIAETVAEVVEAPVVEVVKPKGLTETWKFKVVDESAIPRELLILDEKKVKEWMKTNKDKLSSGLVVGGIEFYIEESIRLR